MKGDSGLFDDTMGERQLADEEEQELITDCLHNVSITKSHTISTTSDPNSVTVKLDDNGNIEKERYYDNKGQAILDIDYTNHGNPKLHSKVPHKHKWDWSDPKNPKRSNKDE